MATAIVIGGRLFVEGRVTALTFQKRNRARVNVHLNGRFAFGLAAIEAARLRVGQLLSAQEVAELKERDADEQAYERALNLLSYRPRSMMEISRRLRRADFSSSAVQAALVRLERAGLADDHAFARYWVDNRERFRPRGTRMLRWELRQKGVTDDIIEEVLAGVNEKASASRLASHRAPRLRDLDELTFRQRLSAYLARRGFSYAIVAEVVRTAWEDLLALRQEAEEESRPADGTPTD
jgi:regulatory protein